MTLRAAALLGVSSFAFAACATPHTNHVHAEPQATATAAQEAPPAAPKEPIDVTTALDTAAIDRLTGAKGRAIGKQVYRVDVARPELKVSADGAPVDGGMLPTWATFQPLGDGQTMMMADVTLVENQVNPIIKLALEQGFEVSALHNHYLWESPRLMFIHFGAMGDATAMAEGVGKVFKALQQLPDASRKKIALGGNTPFDVDSINAVLGRKGVIRNNRYALAIDRPVTHHGHDVANGMMMGSIIVFMGTAEMAYTTGDIAVVDGELQAVLKAMLDNGIEIVSIHNHMTAENPRYFYVHFWGARPIAELAPALKKALDATAQ